MEIGAKQYFLNYLRDQVRGSAMSDIVAVARYHARRHQDNHGHFSIPRQVFAYVDHLGYLAYGEPSSQSATRFMRDYFPERYGPIAELVYAMWRHGTIHQFRPFNYMESPPDPAKEPRQVWWLSTNHDRKLERSQNMLVYPVPNEPYAVYLIVNCPQLADDLLLAIDGLIERIETGDLALQGPFDRLWNLRQPQHVERLKASAQMKAELNRQIEVAWQSRDGRLDRNLNVVERHPLALDELAK